MNPSTPCDRLWRKRLDELSSVWPDFVGGRSAGLHKTRVASRRIREALPIVGVCAPPSKVKKLNRKMRQLTRYLGPIRELDVELNILEGDFKSERVPGRAIEMVRREVAFQRQALRQELTENVPVGDLKKLRKKLERVAEGKGPKGKPLGAKAAARREEQWRGVLATRLLRRAKGLDAALDQAGPLYAPDRVHGVRISIKKLRYALEIAHDAGIPRASALVRTLKRQQERLGRLHDLEALLKHIRAAGGAAGVGSRANDLTAYADMLERECRRLHANFVEHRAELLDCVKEVRQQLVPAVTTPPRRQAHVAGARRLPVRARTRAK